MPYYCTVPRCTSMAGKAKNVSFHQFPRDEELAQLWNKILKRGKPYTKYSKVCSLHFTADDYTITSVGKNKGQWRTLRKDAIPSQNLPLDTPPPTGVPRQRSTGSWLPQPPPNVIDPQMQHVAQAIYMRTVLAMHASGATVFENKPVPDGPGLSLPNTSEKSLTDIEQLLKTCKEMVGSPNQHINNVISKTEEQNEERVNHESLNVIERPKSYKCEECTKCFKDPDVFLLHKRTHKRRLEKENLNSNRQSEETLKANPILAGLLNTEANKLETPNNGGFNVNNIMSIENQILAALTFNMEAYIKNLATLMTSTNEEKDNTRNLDNENVSILDDKNSDLGDNSESNAELERIYEHKEHYNIAQSNFESNNEETNLEKHKTENDEDENNLNYLDGSMNESDENSSTHIDFISEVMSKPSSVNDKCSQGADNHMSEESDNDSNNLVIAFDVIDSEGNVKENQDCDV